jgi:hypothetical protein
MHQNTFRAKLLVPFRVQIQLTPSRTSNMKVRRTKPWVRTFDEQYTSLVWRPRFCLRLIKTAQVAAELNQQQAYLFWRKDKCVN